jgi:peptidoglycan/xylan/chitin deacetylase (PgdA/CDA1 family)
VRRLLPLVLVIALTATGCSRPGELVAPAPSPSPSVEAPEGPDTPPDSPTPAPPIASTPAPLPSCSDPAVPVTTALAGEVGPHGSQRTTGSAAVALTFDDGPDPVNTPLMLNVLRQCGVKATFCVVGYKVAMFPDVIRRIVAEGHTLCNHTWLHIMQLGTYGQARIRQDLQRTNDAIHAIVPDAPVAYFRAPGGFWTADYVSVARQLAMTSIDWDVDPWDWNFPKYGYGAAMTAHVVSAIESHVRPGSIVLSHDNLKPTTVAAYQILLPWLTARFTLIALPIAATPSTPPLPATVNPAAI